MTGVYPESCCWQMEEKFHPMFLPGRLWEKVCAFTLLHIIYTILKHVYMAVEVCFVLPKLASKTIIIIIQKPFVLSESRYNLYND